MKKVLAIFILLGCINKGYAQNKFIPFFGFTQYNKEFEGDFYYTQVGNESIEHNFYLAPMVGLDFNFSKRHAIRYLKSFHIITNRNAYGTSRNIIDIRSYDKLNYLFYFKNTNYVTTGFSYILYKGEAPLSTRFNERYTGNFGLNLGYGKKFEFGYFEVSNLLALEFSEWTPASLFGFWTFDFGYYLGKKTESQRKVYYNQTIFGFGIVGGINFFNQRSDFPANSLMELNYGVDVHANIPKIGLSFFWRRMVGYHLTPNGSRDILFSTRWNNFGIRQIFKLLNNQFYASGSFLAGFNEKLTYKEILVADNVISGISIGLGYPLKHWAFEIQADAYIDVPIPDINTGFGWDRIKLNVIYNLPIISK